MKVRDGWCHVIVTVGVNKQARQPIFSAGSITHLARRLRLSAELATIRQTPVVILQHTWTGEDLQGDEGSGRPALPTNAPQFKSHSLEASGGADLKEDPLLCAPLCAVVMRRLCSVDCVEGRRQRSSVDIIRCYRDRETRRRSQQKQS